MIGVDTNILLRLLLEDDDAQVERLRAAISIAESEGEKLFINDVVLAETVWTLQSRYDTGKPQVIEVLGGLLDNARLVFESRSALADAVRRFETSRAGFADCLILAKNAAAGCLHTFTFDRALRPFEHAKVL